MRKRIVSFVLMLTITLSGVAYAKENTNIKPKMMPLSEQTVNAINRGDSYIPSLLGACSDPVSLKGAAVLPASYNTSPIVFDAENQGVTDICWAFTFNENIELNMVKTTGMKHDFSEQNMKFETSYITNPEHGFLRTPNGTGNELMALAYTTSLGSVYEAVFPFSESVEQQYKATAYYGHVEDCIMQSYIPTEADRNDVVTFIKQQVYENGAVGCALNYQNSPMYENASKSSYYYYGTSLNVNHAVTIVGWDDNYSASNFALAPAGNGAFLVKNSWGNYHNNNTSPYFWLSYYDRTYMTSLYSATYSMDNSAYDNLYQYDYKGYTSTAFFDGFKSAVTSTKFKAKSMNESVTAVSVFTPQNATNVTVLVNPTGGDITDSSNYVVAHTEYFDYSGYHYIEFKNPVKLNSRNYSIAIKYFVENEECVLFPMQSSIQNYCTTENIPETCYVGINFDELTPVEQYFPDAMVCTKAYTKNGTEPTPADSAAKFDDVNEKNWFTDAVDYALGYGIFGGVSETEFKPNSPMNRAMFVRVLANLSHVDIDAFASQKTAFKDVEENRWYTGAVNWASKNGIVNGVDATHFNPNAPVTRQQMCVMLTRYADFVGIEIKKTQSAPKFADDSLIQNYAKEAVYLCKGAGIIKGVTETEFSPRTGAKRADVATLLKNFCELYIY